MARRRGAQTASPAAPFNVCSSRTSNAGSSIGLARRTSLLAGFQLEHRDHLRHTIVADQSAVHSALRHPAPRPASRVAFRQRSADPRRYLPEWKRTSLAASRRAAFPYALAWGGTGANSGLEAGLHVIREGIGGRGNDRDCRKAPAAFTDQPGRRQSVHLRHAHVHKNSVVEEVGGGIHRFQAIPDEVHLDVDPLQQLQGDKLVGRIVFNKAARNGRSEPCRNASNCAVT